MQILIYFLIFIAKVIENALSTLRLIVVANGKKMAGAVLNFVISLVWIISTGLVVVNIQKDPFKVFFFALGSFVGSYCGSLIEEKIAIGSNMLLAITKSPYTEQIQTKLKELNYPCYCLQSNEEDILMVMVSRKKRKNILSLMKNIDENIVIISENARKLALEKVILSNDSDNQ